MHRTKRLLALLLICALAFAFALALPAFADGDPAMPVITAQPKGINIKWRMVNPKEVTLSVEAHIPNGDEIGYRWRENIRGNVIGDTQEIAVDGSTPGMRGYYVEVYNVSNPESYVTSETVLVAVDTAILENVSLALLAIPLYPIIALFSLGGPLGLFLMGYVLSPFDWLFSLFQ